MKIKDLPRIILAMLNIGTKELNENGTLERGFCILEVSAQ